MSTFLKSAEFPSPVDTPEKYTSTVDSERHKATMEVVTFEGVPCVLTGGWYYPLASLHRFQVAEPATKAKK